MRIIMKKTMTRKTAETHLHKTQKMETKMGKIHHLMEAEADRMVMSNKILMVLHQMVEKEEVIHKEMINKTAEMVPQHLLRRIKIIQAETQVQVHKRFALVETWRMMKKE